MNDQSSRKKSVLFPLNSVSLLPVVYASAVVDLTAVVAAETAMGCVDFNTSTDHCLEKRNSQTYPR
jgi:hypothetical protein